MRYGYQYSGEMTTKDAAWEQADNLFTQEGCIRVGVKQCDVDRADGYYAYGVFVATPEELDGPLPDGCRRVVLAGRDLVLAERYDAQNVV